MSAIFGETIDFKQENGPDVPLVVYGDEHYARYETVDGHTVAYDNDIGLYCYAVLTDDGEFESSGVPLSAPPPKGLGLHLEECDSVRFDKAAAKIAARTPPDNGD